MHDVPGSLSHKPRLGASDLAKSLALRPNMGVIAMRGLIRAKTGAIWLNVIAALLIFAGSAWSQTTNPVSPSQAPDVKVTLVADQDAVVPGKPFRLGVHFELPDGWHIYHKDPGEIGKATTFDVVAPANYGVGETQWLPTKTFTDFGMKSFGYEKSTTISVTVTPPAVLSNGPAGATSAEFRATVTGLACKEECVPFTKDLTITLPVVASASAVHETNSSLFAGLPPAGAANKPTGSIIDQNLNVDPTDGSPAGILLYVLFAFIGGLILNLMPCVLPVISLKILSFVKQADKEPGKVIRHGIAYTAGTLASFLALALTVVIARSAGHLIGWGFQFQSPTFLIILSAVVTALSLSMFGLFYIDVGSGSDKLSSMSNAKGYAGSFFTGVLATVLSTPCSAPFLGTAIGFAFAQPAWLVILLFLTVGLGLSAPYLVLSAKPAWLKKIPKPGQWMENFKQLMGFVLLGSVVWLLSIVAVQLGTSAIAWVLGFLLVVCFACWLWARLVDFEASGRKKLTVAAVLSAIVGGAFLWFVVPSVTAPTVPATQAGASTTDAVKFTPFSVAALDKALADKKTVFIDFTAEWCLTCKVNERVAINKEAVGKKLDAGGVVALKADWTNQDPEITRMLSKLGRSAVPTYVIFPGGDPTHPIVLSEIISEQQLLDALDKAGPSVK